MTTGAPSVVVVGTTAAAGMADVDVDTGTGTVDGARVESGMAEGGITCFLLDFKNGDESLSE